MSNCATCNDSGFIMAPDADGESAHEEACCDPVHSMSGDWAVLELMGHRQAIGCISEQAIAGRTMIRIERIDTEPDSVQLYGPESVYCLTPVTEDQARALAAQRYKTRLVPVAALTAAGMDEDDWADRDDDDEDPF